MLFFQKRLLYVSREIGTHFTIVQSHFYRKRVRFLCLRQDFFQTHCSIAFNFFAQPRTCATCGIPWYRAMTLPQKGSPSKAHKQKWPLAWARGAKGPYIYRSLPFSFFSFFGPPGPTQAPKMPIKNGPAAHFWWAFLGPGWGQGGAQRRKRKKKVGIYIYRGLWPPWPRPGAVS